MRNEDKTNDPLIRDLKKRIAALEDQRTDSGQNENMADREQRLRLVFEATNDGYWDWIPTTGETYFSPRYYTMLGYEPDEFPHVYESWRNRAHPDDVERIETVVQKALENHSSFSAEFRMKAKNGSWRWLLTRGKAVEQDTEGRSVRMVGTHTDITERKKAEDALQKSNFFLNRSQEAGNIGSFVLDIPNDDPGAQTWESTPEMDRIFGVDATYPRTGESWLALIVQREEVLAYFNQQVLNAKKNFKKEYQIVRPSDGEVRWIFGHGELEFDDQGNCIRLIGTVQDVTERKRADELLRQSQTQLSEAMKMANAAHWEYDVASDTFTFNDHFYRIFRTTVEEVGGYHMSSAEYARRFYHPEDVQKVVKEVQAVIGASDPEYYPLFEHRILYADGEVGHIAVRFFVVKDDRGRHIRVFGVSQDITERKKAEESRRFTQFAIDNTIDQAFWTTSDGHFVYVNEAACHTLGYSREELMRLSVFDIVPLFTPETFAEHWRGLQKNKNASFESFHRSKGGRVYPVEVRSNYVVFDGREYNCAFVTDITERKRMETEREALIKELQKALTEITELRGILPICSNCKKIRDDKGYWTQIESYIHEHSGAEFSHGICPDCMKKLYPEYADDED